MRENPQELPETPIEDPGEEPDGVIDLSRYRVLVAGNVEKPLKELVALAGMGVTVRAVLQAPAGVRAKLEQLQLDELVTPETDASLEAEAFRRASGVHLVWLVGSKAGMLERTLLPLLQECAAASLDDLLPLVRLDDPALGYLRTGKRWGYYLVGRALGLDAKTARAYMEDCCGYEKQDQERE
jgi:hypothetical protein